MATQLHITFAQAQELGKKSTAASDEYSKARIALDCYARHIAESVFAGQSAEYIAATTRAKYAELLVAERAAWQKFEAAAAAHTAAITILYPPKPTAPDIGNAGACGYCHSYACTCDK